MGSFSHMWLIHFLTNWSTSPSWPVVLSLSNYSVMFQCLQKKTIHLEPLPHPQFPLTSHPQSNNLGKEEEEIVDNFEKAGHSMTYSLNKNWIEEFTTTTLAVLLIRPWPELALVYCSQITCFVGRLVFPGLFHPFLLDFLTSATCRSSVAGVNLSSPLSSCNHLADEFSGCIS